MEKGSAALSGNWRLKCYTRCALKVHYLFPHIAFKPFQPGCCNVTKIHQEVSLTCLHLGVTPPSPHSSVEHNFLSDFFPLSLSDLSVTVHSCTPTHSLTPKDKTHWGHIHLEKKQKYVGFFFFFHFKMFYFSVTYKCLMQSDTSSKHVHKLQLSEKKACQLS